MRYKITNGYTLVRYYDNWWDLVGFVISNESSIAHNKNDIHSYYDFSFRRQLDEDVDYYKIIADQAKDYLLSNNREYFPNKRNVYQRCYFIYDEFDNAVNLHEIRESYRYYKDELKRKCYSRKKILRGEFFDYRKDPVPFTGKPVRWSRKRRHKKLNKSYCVKLNEYKDDFPSDARLRSIADRFDMDYYDYYKCFQRSWKHHSKKRKQWM